MRFADSRWITAVTSYSRKITTTRKELVKKLEHQQNFMLRGEPCGTESTLVFQRRDVAVE